MELVCRPDTPPQSLKRNGSSLFLRFRPKQQTKQQPHGSGPQHKQPFQPERRQHIPQAIFNNWDEFELAAQQQAEIQQFDGWPLWNAEQQGHQQCPLVRFRRNPLLNSGQCKRPADMGSPDCQLHHTSGLQKDMVLVPFRRSILYI